jgi:hypothetical protein
MIRVDSALANVHAKNGCYLCGNPNRLIDTEVSVDYEGVLAICEGCVKDLAQTAGFNLEIRSEEVEGLRTDLADAQVERDSLGRALTEVKTTAQAAEKRHRERMRHARQKAEALDAD